MSITTISLSYSIAIMFLPMLISPKPPTGIILSFLPPLLSRGWRFWPLRLNCCPSYPLNTDLFTGTLMMCCADCLLTLSLIRRDARCTSPRRVWVLARTVFCSRRFWVLLLLRFDRSSPWGFCNFLPPIIFIILSLGFILINFLYNCWNLAEIL